MTNKENKGFTLIEMLIVIGIISITTTISLANLKGAKKEAILDNAQETIAQALEKARNKAATGTGSQDHGVHIETDRVITFEGPSYTPGTGEETLLPKSIETDQPNLTVVFERITAQPNQGAVINIQNQEGTTKTIQLTPEGKIIKSQ